VKGLFFTVQKALPLFKDGGSIILNASVANVMGVPTFTAYAARRGQSEGPGAFSAACFKRA
jgi:NAD(P)-dependent dehydrogenase (short-subunit alcohol dehydrogenase family)